MSTIAAPLAASPWVEFTAALPVLYPRIRRFALKLTRDPDAAEDLVQDTMLIGWERLSQYEHRCSLFTWLGHICLNVFRSQLRYRRTRKRQAVELPSAADFSFDLIEARADLYRMARHKLTEREQDGFRIVLAGGDIKGTCAYRGIYKMQRFYRQRPSGEEEK